MITRIPQSGTMLTGVVVVTPDNGTPVRGMLFAHGLGQKGPGDATSLYNWFKDENGKELVALSNEARIIIVAPQLIESNWSNKYFDFAYQYLRASFTVNPLAYIQGLSWGGQVIWSWAAANQDKVANVFACCAVYPYPNEPANWSLIKTPALAYHAEFDPTVPYHEGLLAINKINAANNPDNAKMTKLPLNYHEIWKRDVYSKDEVRQFYGLPASGGGGPINPPSNSTLKADASATKTAVTGTTAMLDGSLSTGYKNESSVSWENTSSPQGATWDIWDMPNNGKIGLQVKLKNLIPGQYGFQLTVVDAAGAKSKDGVTINVSEEEQPPSEGEFVFTGKKYKAIKPDGTFEIVTLSEV